jgi:hypothetical protein
MTISGGVSLRRAANSSVVSWNTRKVEFTLFKLVGRAWLSWLSVNHNPSGKGRDVALTRELQLVRRHLGFTEWHADSQICYVSEDFSRRRSWREVRRRVHASRPSLTAKMYLE